MLPKSLTLLNRRAMQGQNELERGFQATICKERRDDRRGPRVTLSETPTSLFNKALRMPSLFYLNLHSARFKSIVRRSYFGELAIMPDNSAPERKGAEKGAGPGTRLPGMKMLPRSLFHLLRSVSPK